MTLTSPPIIPRAADSHSTARWVLITSILASGMAFIDGTALSVALPALQADLDATGANLLWVTNGFSLPLAALLLFGGALGDSFGRRRIFLAGILIFTTASLACGLAPNVAVLIGARAVQGVGGACMIPGSLAMISSAFPPATRGKAIGAWSAFSVLATTIGPVVGGLLASAGVWRGVFFINVPIAAVVLTVLVLKIPADLAPTRVLSVDWWGALWVTLGLAGLNFGLIQWPKSALADPIVFAPLSGGALALALFFATERHVREPLLPLDVFKSRTLRAACVLSFLFYMGFHGTLFFLPLNLIQVQGYSPALAGLTQLPLMALLVLLSQWAGRLVDRRGPRLPLTIGPFVGGLGFLLLAWPGVTQGPRDFSSSFLPGLILIGVGLGFTAVPLSTTVMTSVSSDRLGLASGINSSVTRLAGVFAIAVLGPTTLVMFSRALTIRVTEMNLPSEVVAALARESTKLALAEVPAGLGTDMVVAANRAIKLAFVDAFRVTVGIAAVLCWVGAAVAAFRLRKPGGSERHIRHN